MTDLSYTPPQSGSRAGKIALRWTLYIMLGLFALFYLMPLFVMVMTSIKSLDEIRTGDLISLPREVTFEAWRTAWSSACTCLLYTSPSPRDKRQSRMPSSA